MQQIIVQNLKTLRRGPTKGREDDVVFLHMLLNYHLGPPHDQLPVQGSGATDFGPRTEAKVKKFQQINKIDINTPYFMDGVVGKHTWAALTEPILMKAVVFASPRLQLTPPSPPILPNFLAKPPIIPVPKLTLPPITVQSGAQFTIPFDGTPVTTSHAFQVTATLLKKKDGIVRELQAGPAIVETPSGSTDKTDFGFIAQVSTGDLLVTGPIVWSVQAQAALLKSLTDRAASVQINPFLQADLTVFKRGTIVVLKITGQGGVVTELDTPGRDNNRRWEGKVLLGGFLGLTATFGEVDDSRK
jgi:peptidoglycan hydrolase-like protein with peptidoglycan-binding domain